MVPDNRRQLPVTENRFHHGSGEIRCPRHDRQIDDMPAIRRAVRVVEVRIRRVHDRRPGDLGRRRIAHTLRDRPVGQHAQVVLQPPLQREQQRGVIRATGVIELADSAVELPLHRTCELQHTPCIRVARRGRGSEDRRVQLGRAPQMARVISEVAGGDQPVADLPLNAEVPLLQRRRLSMERRVHVNAERRECLRRPSRVERRERIAAWIAEVRIGEPSRRIGDRNLRAPRGVVRKPRIEEEMRRVVEDAPRRPDARPLVPVRRPHHPHARSELPLLPERRAGVGISGVARED